ncbi:GGDEF domain-containing protein [Actinoplanes sp. SE50/110]|uniref:GGDEF domain-containing protein n=1 Tax=Actinoplanes sp. (strain ATCC 31044 / CBS 674.73 / SE50/110) TaxID=134676 RepID=UPI0012BB15D8|nr:GGDEF domain-containing protein [Actinoplanes sp. SE50/110]
MQQLVGIPMSRVAARVGAATIVLTATVAVVTAVAALLGPGVPIGRDSSLYVLYTLSVMLASAACLCRAVVTRLERPAWILLGAALLLWACGNVYAQVWLRHLDSYPLLSWGDAAWLSWYPLVGAALIMLMRTRISAVPRNLWFDGVMVGCASGAVYAVVVFGGRSTATKGWIDLLAGFAYPTGDIVLLAMVTSVLIVHGWRLHGGWGWLVVGLAGSTVIDGGYLAEQVSDRLLYGTWPVVAFALARSAWQPMPRVEQVKLTGRRMFAAPALCALVVLAVLLHAVYAHTNPVAVSLVTVSYLTLMARVGLLFADVRRAQTLLEAAHAAADQLSRTDPLTGLANRRAVGAVFDQTRGSGHGVGVLLVDIDHFKQVNDRYGHEAGDAVIVAVTGRMTRAVRRGDVVGRWGGEEFCALLDAIPDLEVLRQVAEKVRTAVCGEPVLLPDGHRVDVTVSVGAILIDDLTPLDFAISAADERLYAAKNAGRNRVRASVAAPYDAPASQANSPA